MAIVCNQAGALLRRLVATRNGGEALSEETVEPDPMKLVTGRSAIDGAILMTQRILSHTEELMNELQCDPAC